MPSRIYVICNSYESGYGHGLKNDGFDLSKTPHGDPECGEAYQNGYEEGLERYKQDKALEISGKFPFSWEKEAMSNKPDTEQHLMTTTENNVMDDALWRSVDIVQPEIDRLQAELAEVKAQRDRLLEAISSQSYERVMRCSAEIESTKEEA